jgi:hypothetical protein
LKLTFSTGLLDELDHQVLVRGARVPNNHISTVVHNAIDVIHDSDRHFNGISDASNAKLIANVAEHNRNNCDIIHLGQHTASGRAINVHEWSSQCRNFFHKCNSRCCNSFH